MAFNIGMEPVRETGTWPRWVNLALGLWLVVSAFVWPHTRGAMTNTWVVGVLMGAFAVAAMFLPSMRHATSILAAWLFVFTLIIRDLNDGLVWNNLVVAVVAFALSRVASHAAVHRRPGGHAHA